MNPIERLFNFLSYSNFKEYIPSIKRENILWDRLDAANENRRKHIEECEHLWLRVKSLEEQGLLLRERVRVLEKAIIKHKRSKNTLEIGVEDVDLWNEVEG